jgi:hypothetical protein
LADEARTSIASKVGAGIADLVMENLGFFWRANAREILLSKTRTKIPDFVYDPAERHGYETNSVIAVEAKGSISKVRAATRRLHALARNAYDKQVRPFVNHRLNGITVASGYAVAFGAIPGRRSSSVVLATPEKLRVGEVGICVPVSLSAAASVEVQPMQVQKKRKIPYHEQLRQPVFGGGGGRGGGRERGGGRRAAPSGRIALASYESVFELCGAWHAADRIRMMLTETAEDLEETVQRFWVFGERDRFLVGQDEFVAGAFRKEDIFAIYEPSAKEILAVVGDNVSVPGSITIETVPQELRGGDFRETPFVVQGDGLALITSSPPRSISWSSLRGWIGG